MVIFGSTTSYNNYYQVSFKLENDLGVEAQKCWFSQLGFMVLLKMNGFIWVFAWYNTSESQGLEEILGLTAELKEYS